MGLNGRTHPQVNEDARKGLSKNSKSSGQKTCSNNTDSVLFSIPSHRRNCPFTAGQGWMTINAWLRLVPFPLTIRGPSTHHRPTLGRALSALIDWPIPMPIASYRTCRSIKSEPRVHMCAISKSLKSNYNLSVTNNASDDAMILLYICRFLDMESEA